MLNYFKKFLICTKSGKFIFFFFAFPYRAFTFACRLFAAKIRKTKVANHDNFNRTSDRVYILGSGASVNSIESWKTIARHNSIGFNFWVLHPFVPTCYFIEIPRDHDRMALYMKALNERSVDYSNVQSFYLSNGDRRIEKKVFDLLKCYEYIPFTIAAPSIAVYRFIAKIFSSNLLPVKLKFFYAEGTSSVDRIVNFCIAVGYKEIVLCGVDLSDVSYFYEDCSSVHPTVRGAIPKSGHAGRLIHKTNDSNEPRVGLTVTESILAIMPLCNKRGVSLFVENPNSSLAKYLTVMKH